MDKEIDRRNYMENQFKYYGIEYTRISGNRFEANKVEEWSDILHDDNIIINNMGKIDSRVLANFVSHITFLKEWYESSDEDYIILMEDDYDLSLIDYWHFDWSYLMTKLPFDWDTIQIGYEHFDRIEFFLSHKDYRSFNFGPTLINREYVKKILNLFFVHGKIFRRDFSCYGLTDKTISVDETINHMGKNYTIPLITTNTDFFKDDNSWRVYKRHQTNRYIYHYWWKNKRDQFTLDDFFTMNKPNDNDMTEYLYNYESRALSF
jgi:hypothetical protein